MDSLTHFHSRNVYFYIHYSNSLKVTALHMLQKIWVHTSLTQGQKDTRFPRPFEFLGLHKVQKIEVRALAAWGPGARLRVPVGCPWWRSRGRSPWKLLCFSMQEPRAVYIKIVKFKNIIAPIFFTNLTHVSGFFWGGQNGTHVYNFLCKIHPFGRHIPVYLT